MALQFGDSCGAKLSHLFNRATPKVENCVTDMLAIGEIE